MSRWQPDAHGRLQEAALALFDERGYDDTTVAEIAERAGLTKRTFFRYFADKREVLFSRTERLEQLIVEAVVAAPEGTAPLDAVAAGLDAAAVMFEPVRDFATRRQRVIVASPELRERELIKLASLAEAIAGALRGRGAADAAAALAAEAGIAVFRLAFERWTAEPAADGQPLQQLIRDSLAQLRVVAAG